MRMHALIYTCMHACICVYIHACIYTNEYTCINMHASKHTTMHAYIHTCFLLISMLWHRQPIFELKGDKLSSSPECRIRTRVFRTQSPAEWMPRWQTYWAIVDQAKKTWTRQPVPMISEHSAHSTPLSVGFRAWLWRIYMFLVVNFEALTQASDIRIERRQVVFLCWMQDSNQGLCNRISSRPNARWQPDWAIGDQAKNTVKWIWFY